MGSTPKEQSHLKVLETRFDKYALFLSAVVPIAVLLQITRHWHLLGVVSKVVSVALVTALPICPIFLWETRARRGGRLSFLRRLYILYMMIFVAVTLLVSLSPR